MKENEYIHSQALGTVRAAIKVISSLCEKNLTEIIKPGEMQAVGGTLHYWEQRLNQKIKIDDSMAYEIKIKLDEMHEAMLSFGFPFHSVAVIHDQIAGFQVLVLNSQEHRLTRTVRDLVFNSGFNLVVVKKM